MGKIFFGVLLFLSAGAKAACPWGAADSADALRLRTSGLEIEINCPGDIDDPKNEAAAQRYKTFLKETMGLLGRASDQFTTYRELDFIRAVVLSYRTTDVADYDPQIRALRAGLFTNRDEDKERTNLADILKLLEDFNLL